MRRNGYVAALNYMHVHCNLISGREREEPIVQILEYEHSDHSAFNAFVCLSTLVLFATPWQMSHKLPLSVRARLRGLGEAATNRAVPSFTCTRALLFAWPTTQVVEFGREARRDEVETRGRCCSAGRGRNGAPFAHAAIQSAIQQQWLYVQQ